ncbi:MAG TPA: four helix bundle protein [Candidatus Didemnitutus sp.]|nr:four helix bundle protein [Candidatus Didemnitutus sp.]
MEHSSKLLRHFSDLEVYRDAFALGIHVFQLSRQFPAEERYALTDQIRRSSRSVGANIAEAWGKRRYEAHFVSKLSDADAELHECEHWLACATKHRYLTDEEFARLRDRIASIGRRLGAMMRTPKPFLLRAVVATAAIPDKNPNPSPQS